MNHKKDKEKELLNVSELHKLYKKELLILNMKRGMLATFILLASISFVSAQNSISDLLNQIDQSTVVLYAVFLVSFAILFFSLNRVFKDNRSIAGLISAIIAFLLTYFVNKSGLDIQGFFFNLGVSQDLLSTILPLIILGGIVLIIIKLKKSSLFLFGALLIGLSFFVYEGIMNFSLIL
jgi:hypothetical protein